MPSPYPPAMQNLLDQFANVSLADDKIVQVGAFQPHELVRVHNNPASLVLTNEFENNLATTTVVLLTDGATRTGLKFKPDISIIHDRQGRHISLIVASSINQTILVEFAGYPAKEIDVVANEPSITNIGELFGIPLIASTASFFDVATGDGGNASGYRLISALLEAEELVYQGGVISLLNDDNTPGFAISGPISAGQPVGFSMPVSMIHGIHPFYEICLLISEHSSPTDAYNEKNSGIGAYVLDWTEGGGQTGISVNTPEEPFVYSKTGSLLQLTANISTDRIEFEVFDPADESTDSYELARPGIHLSPLYFHIVISLYGLASTLNPIQQIRLNTLLPEINA